MAVFFTYGERSEGEARDKNFDSPLRRGLCCGTLCVWLLDKTRQASADEPFGKAGRKMVRGGRGRTAAERPGLFANPGKRV